MVSDVVLQKHIRKVYDHSRVRRLDDLNVWVKLLKTFLQVDA